MGWTVNQEYQITALISIDLEEEDDTDAQALLTNARSID
jgi:hypothetical protein